MKKVSKHAVSLTFDTVNCFPVPIVLGDTSHVGVALFVTASLEWQEKLLKKFPTGNYEGRTDALRKEAERLKLNTMCGPLFMQFVGSKAFKNVRLASPKFGKRDTLVNLGQDEGGNSYGLLSHDVEKSGYEKTYHRNHDLLPHTSFFVFLG